MRIRIALNTGIVEVGNVGSDHRVEYTILGSAVNIAGRLQAEATPGGIILSSRTRALVKDHVTCKGPQTIKVKGIDRELDVYRIEPSDLGTLLHPPGSDDASNDIDR